MADRAFICGGQSTSTPEALGGCGRELTRETQRRRVRKADSILLPDGQEAQVWDACTYCPECAAKLGPEWQEPKKRKTG